ncbi:MAG: hypothetical protein P8170_24020 [Gemmatimonadota bacterium]
MNVYVVIAILAAVLFVVGAARFLAPAFRREPDEALADLPPTPLQRRARWVLALGLVWCGALVWILMRTDPVTMGEDQGARLLFTTVLIAGAVGYGALILFMQLGRRGEVAVDERDQQILARASRIQGGLTMLCLAIWSVALTEVYWEEGAIPVAFPYIIFWSTFAVYLVSHSAGILLGYAMWRGDAEG